MSDLERKIGGLEVTCRLTLGESLLPEELDWLREGFTDVLAESHGLRLTNGKDIALLAKRLAWVIGAKL